MTACNSIALDLPKGHNLRKALLQYKQRFEDAVDELLEFWVVNISWCYNRLEFPLVNCTLSGKSVMDIYGKTCMDNWMILGLNGPGYWTQVMGGILSLVLKSSKNLAILMYPHYPWFAFELPLISFDSGDSLLGISKVENHEIAAQSSEPRFRSAGWRNSVSTQVPHIQKFHLFRKFTHT